MPEAEKSAAREKLGATVASVTRNTAAAFVRINAGARQLDDAIAAVRAGAYGLFIPKAADPGALEGLAGSLRAEETALGRPARLRCDDRDRCAARARAIARCAGRPSFGAEDLTAINVVRDARGAAPSQAGCTSREARAIVVRVAGRSRILETRVLARRRERPSARFRPPPHPQRGADPQRGVSADRCRAGGERVLAAAEGSDAAFTIEAPVERR